MDTLSGLSHDTDSEVAMVCSVMNTCKRFKVLFLFSKKQKNLQWVLQCAIISLGLIGAGTNNAQIASMLQGLAKHYSKEGSLLFCVSVFFFFPLLFCCYYLSWLVRCNYSY